MSPSNPGSDSSALLDHDYRRKYLVANPPPDADHHDPAKRRRTHLKACDPCCKRKIRCDKTRPCGHCVSQLLQCTDSRQRKKSGPKDTHPTILNSINSLGNVLDQSPQYLSGVPQRMLEGASYSSSVSPAQSMYDSTSPVALGHSYGLIESESDRFYKPSLALLIENLSIIGNEPIVLELLKPLTVQLLILNHAKHVQFLRELLGPGADLDDDIRIMEFHRDSVALSRLMLIFTLNLIIAEIFIKLKKQKFRSFAVYPKRNLLFRNYKNFKSLCHFKCIEIMALLEKNFIVPAVVPQKAVRTLAPGNAMLGTMHQIHYNLSLSFLHLSHYYHMMNLTNTLNHGNVSRDPDLFCFGNESQEQHKLINLSKSVAYFELIQIKRTGVVLAMAVQLCELFEAIFTIERFFLVFLSGSYIAALTRNNDVIVKLDSPRLLRTRLDSMDLLVTPNSTFDLMNVLHVDSGLVADNLIAKLSKFTGFGALPAICLDPHQSELESFSRRKASIDAVAVDSPILQVLKCILVFKLVLIHTLEVAIVEREIIQVVTSLVQLLKTARSDLFTLQVSNYQALPPILHILKIVLEYRAELLQNISTAILVEFSDLLIAHFGLFNNISRLIRSSRVLNNWFVDLKSVRALVAGNTETDMHSDPLQPNQQGQSQDQGQGQVQIQGQSQGQSQIPGQSQDQNQTQGQIQDQSQIMSQIHSPANIANIQQQRTGQTPPNVVELHRLPTGQTPPNHNNVGHPGLAMKFPPQPLPHAAISIHPHPHPQIHPQSYPQAHPQSRPQGHPQSHPQIHPQSHPQSHPQAHPQSHPQSRQSKHTNISPNNHYTPAELKTPVSTIALASLVENASRGSSAIDNRSWSAPGGADKEYEGIPRSEQTASGPGSHNSLGNDSPQTTPLVHLPQYSPAMNPVHDVVEPDVRDALDDFRYQQEYAQYVALGNAHNNVHGDGYGQGLATNDTFYTNLVLKLNTNASSNEAVDAPSDQPMSLATSQSTLNSSANMANAYIAMSESTKNLYNFFTKLGDQGLRCTSMTNLNQMADYYGDVREKAEENDEGAKFWI